ncbi:unnamed protein product, partial [Diamesa hyperborea]
AWHTRCVSPTQVAITAAHRALILDLHNSLRSRLALGQVSGFSTARRMAQMVWNNELAFLAQLQTRTCNPTRDACRNTPEFSSSGQNIAQITANSYVPAHLLINKSINMWYSENEYAKQSDIDKLSGVYTNNNQAIGHFTQLVNERTTHVGCAISYFDSKGMQSYFVCNYASANIRGLPIYKSGKTASKCTLKNNLKYPGLCR